MQTAAEFVEKVLPCALRKEVAPCDGPNPCHNCSLRPTLIRELEQRDEEHELHREMLGDSIAALEARMGEIRVLCEPPQHGHDVARIYSLAGGKS